MARFHLMLSMDGIIIFLPAPILNARLELGLFEPGKEEKVGEVMVEMSNSFTKAITGFCQFHIRFPETSDPGEKLLIIAAIILVQFTCYLPIVHFELMSRRDMRSVDTIYHTYIS